MKNVGDRKIILESRDHQYHSREENYREAGNASAAGGFTQPPRSGSLDDERQQTRQERVGAQGQCEEERKTAYLRHGGIQPCIFSETGDRSNFQAGRTEDFQRALPSFERDELRSTCLLSGPNDGVRA